MPRSFRPAPVGSGESQLGFFRRSQGFTLIELLVVIAIIAILASILVPAVRTALDKGYMSTCASNQHQFALFCISYAMENEDAFPTTNSANPGTLRWAYGEKFSEFIGGRGSAKVLYCPSLGESERTVENFLNPQNPWAPNEFPIGYFYLGNPDDPASPKFAKPLTAINYEANPLAQLVVDICRASSPSPRQAVQVQNWLSFPHYGIDDARVSQQTMADGHTEPRTLQEMSLGFRYAAPSSIYW